QLHKILQRRPKPSEWHAAAKIRRHRRKDISPMKRPADRLQKELRVLQGANLLHFFIRQSPGKDTVVWSDENVTGRLHGNSSPRAAHSGIYYRDTDRSSGKIGATGRNGEGAAANVPRRNSVG